MRAFPEAIPGIEPASGKTLALTNKNPYKGNLSSLEEKIGSILILVLL